MSEQEKYEIKDFVNDLDECLLKLKGAYNDNYTPILFKRDFDIIQLNREGLLDYTPDQFITLSSGYKLVIREWRKPGNNDLVDISTYKSNEL